MLVRINLPLPQTVWSDDDSMAHKLLPEVDYLTKPGRTVSEVLNKAAVLLTAEVRARP